MATTACIIAFTISLFLFAASIGFAVFRYFADKRSGKSSEKSRILKPSYIALLGVFFAVFALFYPVYHYSVFAEEHDFLKIVKTVLLSAQHALQVFVINTDFGIIKDFVSNPENVAAGFGKAYSVYASVTYIVAPTLIATFILFLFMEVISRVKYATKFRKNIYIMSELNEISIVLATDIHKKEGRKGLIVFAGVQKNDEDEDSDLIESARHLGAICFKNDITNLNLRPSLKKIKRKLYFISENGGDNVSKALDVMKDCLDKKNINTEKTEFYVFSTSLEGEILLNSANIGNMKVRRVNDNKNLVWHTLRRNSVFKDAITTESGVKEMNVVIVGCGNYGVELVKALCWLGQMPKHKISIHVFDKDGNTEERMRFLAPELVERSGIREEGESYYKLHFYSDTDVTSSSFITKLNQIERVTTAFVSLGSDELNIDTAVRMRIEFSRHGYGKDNPSIYPIVYSDTLCKIASNGQGLKMFGKDRDRKNREMSYNLKFIGAMDTRYSVENIEQEDLESKALKYHTSWAMLNNPEGPERDKLVDADTKKFNQYEYYRVSSMAQAIYNEYLVEKIKKLLSEGGEITKELIVLFNRHEHNRWNAYMRAEGYIFNAQRYDLSKQHDDLKSFDLLPPEEQAKDNAWRVALAIEEGKEIQ